MNEREPDYYAILNLPPDSSIDTVREQYRRLVMVFHPDRNGGDIWCEQQLKLINNAYEILSRPDGKSEYDLRRGRRAADTIDFGVAFAADAPEESAQPAVDSAWTFTASEPAQGAQPSPPGQKQSWSDLFAEPPVARATLRPVHSDPASIRRSGRGGYIAAAAMGVLVAAAFFAGEHHARGHVQRSGALAAAGAYHDSAARRYRQSVDAADLAMMSSATITPQDIERADAQRHDEAVEMRARIAPYWDRFKRAEPGAEAAVIAGKNLLVAMQSLDERDLGGSPPVGSGRFRDEAKLSSDIQELQDKIADIQARFDDLDYMTGPDDVSGSLAEIDRLLSSIEHEQDPLFEDLRLAAAETAGAHR